MGNQIYFMSTFFEDCLLGTAISFVFFENYWFRKYENGDYKTENSNYHEPYTFLCYHKDTEHKFLPYIHPLGYLGHLKLWCIYSLHYFAP